MEVDSVNQTACLTQERAQSVLNCLKTLSGRTAVPLKFVQRLLGHMAAAAATVCSLWDRFSTGSMAKSLGERGNVVLTGFRLHRSASKPSARGQIPRSFRQECLWSRYPDMLWYSRMPRPPAGEPHTTGTQYQGFGQVPNCVGISIASSCWQYALPWAASEGAFSARTFWSIWTTLWPLRISTGKAVYAPIACRNLPATSYSGVRSIWGPFIPSTSQESLIGQPTSCLKQHFQASGDSIPRRFSWFGDVTP